MSNETPTIDVDWHLGVPGWRLGGRHVRLADVVAAQPERAKHRIIQHRQAVSLMGIVLDKLLAELEEVEVNEPDW